MHKRILISAGPTWVKVDKIRVLSNIASGEIGFLLSEESLRLGYKVSLALGPVETVKPINNIKLKRFKYFDELYGLIKKELHNRKYDLVIHAAAVSDYKVSGRLKRKIKSDIKNLSIKLKPTPKIVDYIKKASPGIFLVMFKLEDGAIKDSILIKRAKEALVRARADLIVANKIEPAYKAFVLDKNRIYAKVNSKKELAKKIFPIITAKRASWIN